MADPLLEGNYPLKALYQALAVAAMCLQEEATTRPLISDVVTALEYLSGDKNNDDFVGGEDSIEDQVEENIEKNAAAAQESEE